MKKEIKIVVDTDEARSGLILHGECDVFRQDTDEDIINKALNKVEAYNKRFGITVLKRSKPALNENIERNVNIKIDTKIARAMLGCAGFNTDNKSDEEVFSMVLNLISCYGATCKFDREDGVEDADN